MAKRDPNPLVSVVITTRNRWQELQNAVASCLAQDYRPLEILVYDDASEEDIAAKVRVRFPTVRAVRSPENAGYVSLRNRGFREARGKYIFSLDDDAYYTDPQTITPAVRQLEQHPRVAVAALAFTEPGMNGIMGFPHQEGMDSLQPLLVASFTGTAHAVRRQAALEVGGYREFFFHQGEEVDLAVRLMEKGWQILAVPAPPLRHLASPQRDWRRLHIYGPRNAILFNFLNAPFPEVVTRLLVNTLGVLWHGLRVKEPWLKILGVASGYRDCLHYFWQRKPVSAQTWRRFRTLARDPEPLAGQGVA